MQRLGILFGNPTRLTVTTENGYVPQIVNGRLISSENGIYEYDINLAHTPVRDLPSQLSEAKGVRDAEIRKAPIELVIAGLYKTWSISDKSKKRSQAKSFA
jgi:ABC-2 type transport system ATP-binding protein